MQKINFQDLPSTTTPVRASNLNLLQNNVEDVFDGDEPMGNIIVDSIRSKNILPNVNLGDISHFSVGQIPTFTDSLSRVTSFPIFIEMIPNKTYSVSINSGYEFALIYCNNNKETIDSTAYLTSSVITTGSNIKYLCIKIRKEDNTNFTDSDLQNLECQIEEGSTATSYAPYQETKNYDLYLKNEIIIGTWINGKPIYRKVITFNPRTDALETSYAHGISNIDEILPTSSCILYRTSGNFVPLSMVYPDSSTNILAWSCGWQATKSSVVSWIGSTMRQQMDTSRGYGAIAILEYTKTTD